MRKRKTLAALAIFVCLVIFAQTSVFAGAVYLNKIPLGVEIEIKAVSGQNFVPLRSIADMAGAELEWNNKTKTATIYNPFTVKKTVLAKITSGETKVTIRPMDKSGKPLEEVTKELEAAPEIIDSKLYIPLDFIVESFGFTVNYEQKTGNIYLAN
ncbi:MAG: copper amine oxidase N-terminal domain-containing protein [Clostridiales bacterium]|jgi:hypothetical protein|nr:copper amine oxidase N-terminal domain-containing protein [Clostridiales bacterium]